MLIKNIPYEKLKERAGSLQIDKYRLWIDSAFLWAETKEGTQFWRYVDVGNWDKAKELYPEYFE